MPEPRRCECPKCRHNAVGSCGETPRPDPHTKLWLCDRCWFHTDPGQYAKKDG